MMAELTKEKVDVMPMEELEHNIRQMKVFLKSWEIQYAKDFNRKPTKDDVSKNPDIGKLITLSLL